MSAGPQRNLPADTIVETHEVMASLLLDIQMYAWSHIFARHLLPAAPFPKGRVYEDIATVPVLVRSSRNLIYLPVPAVIYRQRDGSISKQKTKSTTIDLAWSMRLAWRSIISSGSPSPSEKEVLLVVWLQTLAWAGVTFYRGRLLSDPDVRREYAECCEAYLAAAGADRFRHLRKMPRAEYPNNIMAGAIVTVGPRALGHIFSQGAVVLDSLRGIRRQVLR